ncbi:MAG: FUSC family protein, partial [bacterium]
MISNYFPFKNRYNLGIFLVSLTTLFYEILLTRIFAVVIYYHFASLAIALALLGLSIGAVFYYLTQGYFSKDYDNAIFYAFIFYCLSYLFVFLLLIFLSHNSEKISALLSYFRDPFYRPTPSLAAKLSLPSSFILWASFLFMLLPFIFSGFLSSLYLTLSAQKIGKIYFWNLFGTSIGCILIFIFLPFFGAPNSFLFICVFGLFCGMLILKKRKILMASILISIIALFIFSLKIEPAKINFVRLRFTDALISKWNSYSHVAVYPLQGDVEVNRSWGISTRYTGFVPPHLNMVVNEIDYTPIINFNGDLSKMEFLKYDLASLPYYLTESPNVLIIGPGGGKELLLAKLFNARHVSAVEINPLVIKFTQETFSEFSGKPYSLPNVDVVVADGRDFVKKSKARYDLITATQVYAYLDPIGSAFSFTENYLYTKEAFIDYLNHLNPKGMLVIIKPFIPEEKLRFFSVAR